MKYEMIDAEPIHRFFGLSYASYLVLPRTILQSMPLEWQRTFVRLLNEAEGAIGAYPQSGQTYDVRLRDSKGRFIHDSLADYQRGRRRILLSEVTP